MTFHHLQEESFRIGITSSNGERANLISIELDFDKDSFFKYFALIDHE
jgi:hypothetical protein